MRASAILALAAVVLLWGLAAVLWPGLPARFPVHFDAAGAPDRWVERTPVQWFLLPGLASGMTLALAFALPAWILRLARANSAYLNVPRKREFARLEPAARARAVVPMVVMLRIVSAEVALLFGAILLGAARVAAGAWSRLPAALVWGAVALVLGTTLASLPFGHAAVRRELERAGR